MRGIMDQIANLVTAKILLISLGEQAIQEVVILLVLVTANQGLLVKIAQNVLTIYTFILIVLVSVDYVP